MSVAARDKEGAEEAFTQSRGTTDKDAIGASPRNSRTNGVLAQLHGHLPMN